MAKLAVGVLFILILGCGVFLAQTSEQHRSCIDSAKTQTQMNACANEEASRVEAELNEVYRKLQTAAANEPSAPAKIAAAERAWIGYRDTYIEAMYPSTDKQAAYGSSFPMQVNLLRAKLAQRQIEALKDLVNRYNGPRQ